MDLAARSPDWSTHSGGALSGGGGCWAESQSTSSGRFGGGKLAGRMLVTVVLEIAPSGAFGLPQDGVTVVSGPREGTGDIYRRIGPDFVRAGYGELSEYRRPEDALCLSIRLPGAHVKIRDNFASVSLEATDTGEAMRAAISTLDKYLRHLMIEEPRPFSVKPLFAETDDGQAARAPFGSTTLANVTGYDLAALREHMEEAATFADLVDERLDRALDYFSHALFLYSKRMGIAGPFSPHQKFLVSSVFLNFWKAATAIIGDPALRKDRFQRRFVDIGLPKAFRSRIERLKKLRDDFDVAHYSLDEDRTQHLEENVAEAQNICRDVISQYRVFLGQDA